jgi:hypothetical protein
MNKLALTTAVLLAFGMSGMARAEHVHAPMSGYEEVPAVSTAASGNFRAMINPAADAIDYEMIFDGLQGTITQAHIHIAQAGVNGAIVIWICGTPATPGPLGTQTCPQSGLVAGTITAANVLASAPTQQIAAGDLDAVIAAIRAGVAYVNVHTSLSPGGEIRGQLRASNRPTPPR